jgi:hypothetical protein
MMEHTPGPWEISRGAQNDPFSIEASACTVAHIKTTPRKWSPEANAHLIAAAPDLLEALEDLISAGAAVHHYLGQATGKIHADALQKARAAIAKAEGH